MQALAPGSGRPCPTPREVFDYVFTKSEEDFARFGSFSPAIYDSAWLSMVYKPDGLNRFPQCFEHLVNTQLDDGTWKSYGSQIDGILNTLASLLSLMERQKRTLVDTKKDSLRLKVELAKNGVQKLLQEWDVEKTVHVGFEILVTSLLRQLEEGGISFNFPGRPKLMAVYKLKMAKFTPEMVYAPVQSTVLHSLEALVGEIDFNKVRLHCTEASGVLGSPSASAAYLIHAADWDERAEIYLERVLDAYGNSGEVPSAFPTPVFELSWALSNLLSHTDVAMDVTSEEVSTIVSFFERTVTEQKGIVGFAPKLLPDADDTARTLMTLKILGVAVDPTPMVAKFENGDHFRTYEHERNPSVSANCNVLLALLELDSDDSYASQVTKILNFLLGAWSSGETPDKWNISHQYTSMLMVEAFVGVLERYNRNQIQGLCSSLALKQIPVALCQILLRTLSVQQENGSWSSSLEETAYCIATMTQCQRLPFNGSVLSRLNEAVASARAYIDAQYPHDQSNRYLWVEKTTYQSNFLKIAYCSMAMHTKEVQSDRIWSSEIASSFQIPEAHTKKIGMLLTALPIFRKSPIASVDLVLLEAMHAANSLKEARHLVMERDSIGFTKDKYLEYIPVIWLACNNIGGHALKDRTIRDMVLLSLFNYQIDEYMESVIAELTNKKLDQLCTRIKAECGLETDSTSSNEDLTRDEPLTKRRKLSIVENSEQIISNTSDSGYEDDHEGACEPNSLDQIVKVLRKYIAYILHHPAVIQAPYWIQRSLAVELHNYLIGQINHNRDNRAYMSSKSDSMNYTSTELAQSTYWKWVNSTGADDTSCPFSWHFFVCLISKAGGTCLDGTLTRYFGESFVRHLAVLCRQYNDFGSTIRDAEEDNLNSINFAEFSIGTIEKPGDAPVKPDMEMTETAKKNLMALAEFERAQMELSLRMLKDNINNPKLAEQLQVFVDVTDTFGQIYVMKDIASKNQSKQK